MSRRSAGSNRKGTGTSMSSRRLSAGGLAALADLLELVGLTDHFSGDAVMYGNDPIIRSPHRLGEAAATTQLLIGVAGSAVWEARGGARTGISIDIIDALHYLHPTHYIEQSGYPSNVGAEYVPVNGIFTTRDGRYIMLEAGPPYQKLPTDTSTSSTAGTTSDPSPVRSPSGAQRISKRR